MIEFTEYNLKKQKEKPKTTEKKVLNQVQSSIIVQLARDKRYVKSRMRDLKKLKGNHKVI